MNEFRMSLLKERADKIRPDLTKARHMLEKAGEENREPTAEELAFTEPIIKAAKEIADGMAKLRDDDAMMSAINDQFAGVMGPLGGSSKSDKSQRLSFKGLGSQIAAKMLPDGQKSLAPSGAVVTAQEFRPSPVELGKPAQSLLDVLPTQQHPSPEFAYLRQTVRTNAAAVVAEGDAKPESTYTVTRVENSLVVIAHLSEGVPRFWLLDNVALDRFIEAELQYGLGLAVEAKVLADVNGTSGIQTQAYATSVLTTIRKSLTKLETAGYSPAALVVHPLDWETVELALSSVNAVEHMSLPYDPASRRLYGVPVVVSNSQAAGVAHAVAVDAVALDTDTAGVQVQWSENATADSFAKNQIIARCEGRFATSVYSPLGVVVADLTA